MNLFEKQRRGRDGRAERQEEQEEQEQKGRRRRRRRGRRGCIGGRRRGQGGQDEEEGAVGAAGQAHQADHPDRLRGHVDRHLHGHRAHRALLHQGVRPGQEAALGGHLLAARQVLHHGHHGAGGGRARGPAARRHHLARLRRQEDDEGQQPGAPPGRVRDDGQRDRHLLGQDGHAHHQPHDRRPVLHRRAPLQGAAQAQRGARGDTPHGGRLHLGEQQLCKQAGEGDQARPARRPDRQQDRVRPPRLCRAPRPRLRHHTRAASDQRLRARLHVQLGPQVHVDRGATPECGGRRASAVQGRQRDGAQQVQVDNDERRRGARV